MKCSSSVVITVAVAVVVAVAEWIFFSKKAKPSNFSFSKTMPLWSARVSIYFLSRAAALALVVERDRFSKLFLFNYEERLGKT